MNARLVIQQAIASEDRSQVSRRYPLSRLPVTVGRGDEADVRVTDPWVSRLHCQIEVRRGMLYVRDLGSKHGTWVNHRRVEESLVFPGDELEIGLTALLAEYAVPTCELS